MSDTRPLCLDCSHHHNTDPDTGPSCPPCDDLAAVGAYAPCQDSDLIPAGAVIDDDPEGFAAELVAEYAAAIERVRDRAQEARYGGRLTTCRLFHRATGAIGYAQDITPADANGLRRDRDARDLADALTGDAIRFTPIYAAGIATPTETATQQTRST